jgi:hypothetical protein
MGIPKNGDGSRSSSGRHAPENESSAEFVGNYGLKTGFEQSI